MHYCFNLIFLDDLRDETRIGNVTHLETGILRYGFPPSRTQVVDDHRAQPCLEQSKDDVAAYITCPPPLPKRNRCCLSSSHPPAAQLPQLQYWRRSAVRPQSGSTRPAEVGCRWRDDGGAKPPWKAALDPNGTMPVGAHDA